MASSAVNTVPPVGRGISTLLKDLIKEFSVFCFIYILCGSSKDRNSHLHQSFCQLDRCLSTELDNCSVRLLNINDTLYIFRCQRLKIQLISNIKVCTYCLRVVIYDDRLISFFCKCPCTVYRTEVKLDSLSDTDRTGSKDKNFLLRIVSLQLHSHYHKRNSSMASLPRTPPHRYLRSCMLPRCRFHGAYRGSLALSFLSARAITLSGNSIRLCFFQKFRCRVPAVFSACLHLYDDRKFINEPLVDLCDVVNHHHSPHLFCMASAILHIRISSTISSCSSQFVHLTDR